MPTRKTVASPMATKTATVITPAQASAFCGYFAAAHAKLATGSADASANLATASANLAAISPHGRGGRADGP